MKLTGDLKNQVEKAESKDEKKKLIEEAGMELTDDELGKVAGGTESEWLPKYRGYQDLRPWRIYCNRCVFETVESGETAQLFCKNPCPNCGIGKLVAEPG